MMHRTMLELVETPVSRTVRTADGRVTGYYEYGDPAGRPVVVLHGTPACGAGFAWADGRARARGIRLLAPDRPGVGDSSPWTAGRGTTVADYPSELARVRRRARPRDVSRSSGTRAADRTRSPPRTTSPTSSRRRPSCPGPDRSESGHRSATSRRPIGCSPSSPAALPSWRACSSRPRRAPRTSRPERRCGSRSSRCRRADHAVMAAVPFRARRARGVQPVVPARRARRRRRLRRARPAVGIRGRGDLGAGPLLARDDRPDRAR